MTGHEIAEARCDACETANWPGGCKVSGSVGALLFGPTDVLADAGAHAGRAGGTTGLMTSVADGRDALSACACWEARCAAFATAGRHETRYGEGGRCTPVGRSVIADQLDAIRFNADLIRHATGIRHDRRPLRGMGRA